MSLRQFLVKKSRCQNDKNGYLSDLELAVLLLFYNEACDTLKALGLEFKCAETAAFDELCRLVNIANARSLKFNGWSYESIKAWIEHIIK